MEIITEKTKQEKLLTKNFRWYVAIALTTASFITTGMLEAPILSSTPYNILAMLLLFSGGVTVLGSFAMCITAVGENKAGLSGFFTAFAIIAYVAIIKSIIG